MIFARDAVGSLLKRAMSANLMPRQDQLWKDSVVESHISVVRLLTPNQIPRMLGSQVPAEARKQMGHLEEKEMMLRVNQFRKWLETDTLIVYQ